MKSEWKTITLEDICTAVYSGGTPKSTIKEYYTGGDIPWLNTKEVNFKKIKSTENFITQDGYNNSSAKWVYKNSIIIAMYGATAGKVCITDINLTTNQACCNISIKNIYNYKYVYYYLFFKYNDLASLANGAAQQNISVKIIKKFPIEVPPIEIQNKIATILSSLDDKIELNNRINDNLQQQAQALFKSWFVDFEPWGGVIPEGWREGTLGEIAEITMGQSPAGETYNDAGEGIPFFQGRGEFDWRFPNRRLFTTAPKRFANEGDILLSVRAPVGDINIALEKCCIGRGLASIRQINNYQSFILYLFTILLKNKLQIYNCQGTVFGSINKKDLSNINFVTPDNMSIKKFNDICYKIDDLIKNNVLENRRLAELRDTLLPKLMSGELDVSNIDIK